MKKLIMAGILTASVLAAGAHGNNTETNKITLIASVTVENFPEWKKAFDAGAAVREQAGIKVLQVCTSAENPKQVIVIEEAENMQSAKAFVELLHQRQKAIHIEVKLYERHT